MAVLTGGGTIFEIGNIADAGTATWTVVGQASSVEASGTAETLDATTLASTRKEFIPGVPDSSDFTVTCFYDPTIASQAQVSGIEALFNGGLRRAVRFTVGNGLGAPAAGARREAYSNCFVTSINRTFNPNAPQELRFSVKTSGAPIYSTTP